MKRLSILILCVAFTVSCVTAQMVVRGDIKVSNTTTGVLRANTPVILKDSASADYPRGVIMNAGTLSLGANAGLIFCSNDRTNGMIVPQASAMTNDVTGFPSNSTFVYKNFAKQRDIWLPMSFPFDVNVADILSANSFLTDDNFAIAEYNSQSRADYGLFQNVQHWEYVATTVGSTAVLSKGQGYRIILTSDYTGSYTTADSVVIFPAASSSDIGTLLRYAAKNTGQVQTYTGAANELNWGWNYIGGLNPCAYNMSTAGNFQWNGTVANWNEAIYYMTILPDTILWDEQVTGQDSIVVSPFVSFFVQVEEANNFTFNPSGIASLTGFPVDFRSPTEQPDKQVLYLKLSDSENRFGDRLYIYQGSQYREGYFIGEDGQKLSAGDQRMRVWSMQGDVPLVVNAVPPKEGREIPVGFSVPAAGTYTFTLEDRTGGMRVDLKDNQTGETVNLLSYPYTFNLNAPESTNDRFVLILNPKGMDIVPVNVTDIYAYTADSRLTVRNLQAGDRVEVLDVVGRLITAGISQGESYSIPLAGKGVYMVCVTGDRNAVLKVINQ